MGFMRIMQEKKQLYNNFLPELSESGITVDIHSRMFNGKFFKTLFIKKEGFTGTYQHVYNYKEDIITV
jgi:hypothetical protein